MLSARKCLEPDYDCAQQRPTRRVAGASSLVKLTLLVSALLAITGCKSTGLLAKREAEKCCPTDIRKTVPWCAGEDALFQCPCEPSPVFYGYKPTCWRTWPASGAAWRDVHCGNQHHRAIITDLTHQNPELIELPALRSLPTPAEQPEASEVPKDESNETELPKPNPPVENGPKPLDIPTLKEPPKFEPAPEAPPLNELPPAEPPPLIDPPPPPATNGPDPEAIESASPRPILGPIPLPPIDEE
ncbi:MAG: hypothetical protein AAGD11_16455 [Planctomycetota bacterium]